MLKRVLKSKAYYLQRKDSITECHVPEMMCESSREDGESYCRPRKRSPLSPFGIVHQSLELSLSSTLTSPCGISREKEIQLSNRASNETLRASARGVSPLPEMFERKQEKAGSECLRILFQACLTLTLAEYQASLRVLRKVGRSTREFISNASFATFVK